MCDQKKKKSSLFSKNLVVRLFAKTEMIRKKFNFYLLPNTFLIVLENENTICIY